MIRHSSSIPDARLILHYQPPLPRDRSLSGSRSVVPRVEIGPVWRVRAFETGCVGACFGRGPRCGGSRSWGRMGWASPLRGGFVSACVCRGWWVLHTRVHSASAGTAESCGTAPSVAATVMLPCAQTPLTAHGNPTTTHYDHQKIPSFQQKTALTPQRPRPPMCNTNDNHTRSTHPPRLAPRSVHFRLEIGPIQLGRTDVETRTTSSRAKATCRTSEPPANSRPTEA